MAIATQTLAVEVADGTFNCYFAAPEAGDAPAVLVLQEIFGVNSHIRSIVERLAELGYAAAAPDVFWRVAPGIELGYEAADVARGRELKGQTDVAATVADISAVTAALAALPQVRSTPPGVIGFCFGGLLAYLAAVRLPLSCAVAYYGGGITDYLDEAEQLNCPLQFHFGGEDAAIPEDHVAQIRAAVQPNPQADLFVYPGAGHGFNCDQRASFDAASATLAWERSQALLAQYLR